MPARFSSSWIPTTVPLNLIGDGLLPADIDGTKQPKEDAAIPIVGTQDVGAGYGATFDAVNIWDLKIHWQANPVSSIEFRGPSSRSRLSTRSSRARRRRATASRSPASPNPTNTSTSCLPPAAHVAPRVPELQGLRVDGHQPVRRGAPRRRRSAVVRDPARRQHLFDSPAGHVRARRRRASLDGQSIAQDKNGNMALGYSVVNGTTVFPGIRYTGRLAGDAAGTR